MSLSAAMTLRCEISRSILVEKQDDRIESPTRLAYGCMIRQSASSQDSWYNGKKIS